MARENWVKYEEEFPDSKGIKHWKGKPEAIKDALWRSLKKSRIAWQLSRGNLGIVPPAPLAFISALIHPLAQTRHIHHGKLQLHSVQ